MTTVLAPDKPLLPRQWLLEPGEPLQLSRSPVTSLAYLGAQADEWGLRPDQLALSPMCALALPRADGLVPPPRCFADRLRPEALWCPLLWLPPYLASPAPDEDEDAWAARVALELSASGVYDQESGTWLDVGQLVEGGLTAERGERWLAGGADPVLDAFDLEELVYDHVDPTWARDKVRGDFPWLYVASCALWSEAVADEIGELLRGPAEGVSAHLGMLVATVGPWFALMPEDVFPGESRWWEQEAPSASALQVLERARGLRDKLEPLLQAALAEGPPSSAGRVPAGEPLH